MKRLYTYITILFFLGISISCIKELEFDREQMTPPRLYLNCIINPDSIFRAYVSYSVNITAPIMDVQEQIELAKRALVLINDEFGNTIDTLEYAEEFITEETSFLTFESPDGKKPLPNTTYEIEFSEPYRNANRVFNAFSTVPSIFQEVEVDTFDPFVEVIHTDPTYRMRLNWDNPPGQDNKYIIEAIFRFKDLNNNTVEHVRASLYTTSNNNDNLTISDPLVNDFLYGFLKDPPPNPDVMLVDPSTTAIAVITEPYIQKAEEIGKSNLEADLIIKLHNADQKVYQYFKDVEDYRKNNNSSIFALPISVMGNIQGSLGVFGSRVTRQDIVPINR